MGKAKSPRRVADNEALAVGTHDSWLGAEAEPRCRADPRQEGRRGDEHPCVLEEGDGQGRQKVLASAIANAENNHDLDVDALVVAEASVGKSITMKRFHTRGRGKSTRILKPFSKLRIVVREEEEEA